MITSIGADSDRADAADEPTPPHLAVDDAAAVAVAATANANSNNNEKEQILDGKEHAVSSSSSSLLYVSSLTDTFSAFSDMASSIAAAAATASLSTLLALGCEGF